MRPEDRREAEQLAEALHQLKKGETFVAGYATHHRCVSVMRNVIGVISQREQLATAFFPRNQLVNPEGGVLLFVTAMDEQTKLRGRVIKGWIGISEQAVKMIQGVA